MLIAGLMFANLAPSNIYAASAEEFDEESTIVAEQQEQPEVDSSTDESASTQEQSQEQPEYTDYSAQVEQPEDATQAESEPVNIEEIVAQAIAQPQPQPRALFNRYALCSTSTIRTIQQFVAEQAGSFMASLICTPIAANNGHIHMKEAARVTMLWTYYGLRYAQRMINFASLVDAIEAGLDTETTTSHDEIHTKAFKDGLPLAAASAIAAFLSTAVNHLFSI
jgi:hypothetical protein